MSLKAGKPKMPFKHWPSKQCVRPFDSEKHYPLPCYIINNFLVERNEVTSDANKIFAEKKVGFAKTKVSYKYFGDANRTSATLIIALYDSSAKRETRKSPIKAFSEYQFPRNSYVFTFDVSSTEGNPWIDERYIEATDKLISALTMAKVIDCNKVYLIGVGDGAKGALHIAARLAYRFAGIAVEMDSDDLKFEAYLRNVNLAVMTSNQSNEVMHRYTKHFETDRAHFKSDPKDLPYKAIVLIDGDIKKVFLPSYSLLKALRNPFPFRIAWEPRNLQKDANFYWIGVPANCAKENAEIYAEIKSKKAVKIEAKNVEKVTIRLNEFLVDFCYSIKVTLNNKLIFKGIPARSSETFTKTAKLFGDPYYFFSFERTFNVL